MGSVRGRTVSAVAGKLSQIQSPQEEAYHSGTVSLLAGTAVAGPSPQPSCGLGCHFGT